MQRRPQLEAASRESGYALVDALVALLIFAVGLIFSFDALRVSRSTIDRATEVRHAQAVLSGLLETAPRTPQDIAGSIDGFDWRLQTRTTGAEAAIQICHRQVLLTNIRTHHRFQAATLETCPTGSAA